MLVVDDAEEFWGMEVNIPHGMLLHLIPLSLLHAGHRGLCVILVETFSLAPSLLLSLYLLLQLLNMRHDLPELPRPIHHIQERP
jgi:hypothetical protein